MTRVCTKVQRLLVVLAVSFAASVAPTARAATGPYWSELPPEQPVRADVRAALPSGLPDLSSLVKRVMPAVVSIVVEQKAPVAEGDPLHELFERFYGDEPVEGMGAGFVIHESGLVVTNQHVIENYRTITVVIDENGAERKLDAKLLGADEQTDVALLQVDAGHPLPALPLGDSDQLDVAEWVVAIGNPFGLSRTVTFGIVSQTGRTDVSPQGREGYFDFVQTDASMNPGSSGGPLLNLRGEVVAINNAINAAGQGIGFAVPINMAKRVLPQLAKDGKVRRAWLGASVRDVSDQLAKDLGLPKVAGVVVNEVTPEGPAAKAGLRPGDVIVGFGGSPVERASRLRWEVACASSGAEVVFDVVRDGKPLRVSAKLQAQPSGAKAALHEGARGLPRLGLSLGEPDAATLAGLGLALPAGALVEELEDAGAAARAGLLEDDLVVGLDDVEIASAEDLARRLEALPAGSRVELRVKRGAGERRLWLRIPAQRT